MATLDVRAEVEKLLADMRTKALTLEDMRDTVEIAAIVRQAAIPSVPNDLIPAYARATLLGAWMTYDIRQRYAV